MVVLRFVPGEAAMPDHRSQAGLQHDTSPYAKASLTIEQLSTPRRYAILRTTRNAQANQVQP